MSSSERILLLTDVPLCKNYTGGLMTAKLARFLLEEKKDLCCFCVMSKELSPDIDISVLNDIDCEFREKPKENFTNSRLFDKKIKKLRKDLIKYIRRKKITKVWGIAQGEVMVDLLDTVRKIGIDYVVQVWDPIEWWMKENNFDKERQERVLEKFGLVLKNTSYCMTSSFAMSRQYHAMYGGVKCVEVISPINKSDVCIDNFKKNKSNFIISISGQIYSKEETEKFLLALQSMGWKYKGKDIVFRYYGTWSDDYIDIKKFNRGKDHIQIMGFLPQRELLKDLSHSDLLYCPYFFSKENCFKKVAVMSFPSKLVTYMAVGVPILVHAPVYASPFKYIDKINGGFLESTLDINHIIKKIKSVIDSDSSYRKKMVSNSKNAFIRSFTSDSVKKVFLKALGLKFNKTKKLRILEVNNVDLPGKRFNGFDLLEKINNETVHSAKQIVTYKTSKNPKVVEFFNTKKLLGLNEKLVENEAEFLSVHSQLSFTSNILLNHDDFINADLVHYHHIHNTKLSLGKMAELINSKPSVMTLHDPWYFTGRCVYPQECDKWMFGCKTCEDLNTLFSFKEDNCNSLWNLKRKIYKKLDVDIVVTTPFMRDMLKKSPLTKDFKHVHVIPFGIDLEKFSNSISRREARKRLKISNDDIVLFFRAQMAAKGTEYIIEALKELKVKQKISLLTCSEKGLLNGLKNDYTIIDLGDIDDKKMIEAYNACDVFLMPSRGESFGLMAIEAMACSRPVVVFNNSALPYVTFAPDCGVLVENKNSYELMKAIKMLIENKKERERRGKLGRKLAEENYNVKVYEKRIIGLYEKAYKRQKDKNKYKLVESDIDYSLSDVQVLIKRLRLIFNNLFDNIKFNTPFLEYEDGYFLDEKQKIDYSLDSVQEVITRFNNYVYNLIRNENKINLKWNGFNDFVWYKKIFFLLKNDRNRLKDIIREKLLGHKLLFFLFRSLFKVLRRIKRVIFNDYYKINLNRIDVINTRLDSLEEENEKIRNEINKIGLTEHKYKK